MVFVGIVFTVGPPISSWTYRMSEYALFFVDVDAQRQRCTRAPFFASASHRGPEKICWNLAKASLALATAIFPRSDASRLRRAGSVSFAIAASMRRSASVSMRETKNDATEATGRKSPPELAYC